MRQTHPDLRCAQRSNPVTAGGSTSCAAQSRGRNSGRLQMRSPVAAGALPSREIRPVVSSAAYVPTDAPQPEVRPVLSIPHRNVAAAWTDSGRLHAGRGFDWPEVLYLTGPCRRGITASEPRGAEPPSVGTGGSGLQFRRRDGCRTYPRVLPAACTGCILGQPASCCFRDELPACSVSRPASAWSPARSRLSLGGVGVSRYRCRPKPGGKSRRLVVPSGEELCRLCPCVRRALRWPIY